MESDLKHLSQRPNLGQLKDLALSGITLTGFSPEPLRVLLEKVAASLQDLDLLWDHGLPSQGHPARPEPLLPAQDLQHLWERPLHGHHGEAAVSQGQAEQFKPRALNSPLESYSTVGGGRGEGEGRACSWGDLLKFGLS